MRLPVFALLAALLLAIPLAADTVVEEIVARVNSDIITRSEFQRSRDQLLNELKQKFGSEADARFAENEKNVLRDLIDQDLLVQKGKDMGITGDTEVIKKLDEIRKQMHLESIEEVEKAAQEQGVSFEDFKQNLRNQIVTQEVIGREVGSKMQITQDEMKAYYDEHAKELERPEQVRMSEIMISTQPKEGEKEKKEPTPEELAAAEQKAHGLLDSIHKGTSFEEVAKKSSEGPTAAQGGDLGYFKRGMLAKELEDLTFGMKPGDVSDVIRTRQGFVILKITEHTAAGIPPMKELEPQIQDAIYMRKLQPALRAYLTKLREDAFIDIKSGYTDTAASPNESKPIYTTVAKPEVKKKRHKKLGIF